MTAVVVPARHAEEVMGTVVSFTVFAPASVDTRTLLQRACDSLQRDDRMFSTWKPDSPMSRYRAGTLSADELPDEVVGVLERCRQLRTLTGGWFDPWAMPGGVDPTGMVKGWAAQRALDVLVDGGVDAALVNAGGDLAAAGTPPGGGGWRIGIRHPWQPVAFAAVVAVTAAVATSGDYERPGQLVDPTTGAVSRRAASATVVGPDLAVADALATALAVGGSDVFDRFSALSGYEAYLIGVDGLEVATEGMPFVPEA
ncbi:FAD:protein FMN transferase [Acidiferrimicrobium sp. IK]|uniref:FAD:protein FMN transferase n=1 Tax=Acidiferrimicrobium sp. IK TaxID=2871700 RepID=UPI0021CAF8B8|nr:FAD:protein FMN transferase [Acidiferrimicrobium sp. IK]MCU4186255.1 FAD:protein FMN transferase [Acidiferrimicrobium sp. IK]